MSRRGRSLLLLLAIVGMHTTLVLLVRWYVRGSLLTPVVLSVPDLLVGEDETVAADAALFDARTGEPQAGVPLHFVLEGETIEGADHSVFTDASGRASVTWARVFGKERTGATAEALVAVSLQSPSRWLLASSGFVSTVAPRRVVARVLCVQPQTQILLVSFDALDRGAGALSSVSTAVSEQIAEESRQQARTIYLAEVAERDRDRIRHGIEMAGLPEGLLLLLDPSSYAASLETCRDRLKTLEAKVGTILCVGKRERESEYQRIFPGARVIRVGFQ